MSTSMNGAYVEAELAGESCAIDPRPSSATAASSVSCTSLCMNFKPCAQYFGSIASCALKTAWATSKQAGNASKLRWQQFLTVACRDLRRGCPVEQLSVSPVSLHG